MKALDTNDKQWLNLTLGGLCLLLGLNLAGSLKGLATIMRWKLLSRKQHSLDEVEFLLGISSLVKVFKRGIRILLRQPATAFVCFIWISLSGLWRVSLALTALTYSYDSENATASREGLVNVTDWQWFSADGQEPEISAEHYAAHSYGLFSANFGYHKHTDTDKSGADASFQFPIEKVDDFWVYYFREFNPNYSSQGVHISCDVSYV